MPKKSDCQCFVFSLYCVVGLGFKEKTQQTSLISTLIQRTTSEIMTENNTTTTEIILKI